MKLQSKKSKTLTIVGIVVAAVVLIGLIIGAVILFGGNQSADDANPTDIVSITMAGYPKREYYVGEEFDSTGAKIQVLTHDMKYTRFVDHNQLTFSGFDSSVPADEQVITVTYKGFTTTFTVSIKAMPTDVPTVTGIEVFDFGTSITKSVWNENGPISLVRGSTLKLVYSDGTMSDPIYIDPTWVWGYQSVSASGNFDLTIKYNHEGVVLEKTVTVTLTD